jgi:hypothetical protein
MPPVVPAYLRRFYCRRARGLSKDWRQQHESSS